MGALSSRISVSQKPHGKLEDVFFLSPSPAKWLSSRSGSAGSGSPSESPGGLFLKDRSQVNRVLEVSDVYWCSEPLKEAGDFQNLSPRTPQRTHRRLEGKDGPSSREVGHSYVVLSVLVRPESDADELRSELWRLNWGQ
ncbi:unnamed protein product, partial [Polarella glacialis]